MMKEITVKFSLAYDNTDFKAVVDDFIAGMSSAPIVVELGKLIVLQASSQAPQR